MITFENLPITIEQFVESANNGDLTFALTIALIIAVSAMFHLFINK